MRKRAIPLLSALAGAAIITALAALGVLRDADLTVSDLLYQQRQARDGKIFLIQIDQEAIDELGPVQDWSREVYARAVELLNADPEARPAVIGLDVIFGGETDPEADGALAYAARYGNVLTAASAEFGTAAVLGEDGEYRPDSFAVLDYRGPYAALAASARTGHVNTMPDADGRIRYAMLTLTAPDGETAPSFALTAARMFRESRGEPEPALPETNSRGFWYLPYTGLPGDYSENISLADLLRGEVDTRRFAGRIVLIGAYTAGLQDSYLTSMDHAEPMFGVEIQANAIEALLREDYPAVVSRWPQLAALFLITLLALFGFWKRWVWVSTPLLALLGGGWVLACRALYHRAGLVLHVLWVPAALALVYAVCLALNYITAALETRRVTRTFQRYVAPEIVGELLKNPEALELGGKLRQIAVLFVDVRGFTTMSEKLEPPQVVEILNRFLTLMSDCILKNGGTLDKFIGDNAMAFWGAPLPLADPAYPAARCAMDMVEGARALSEELEARFGRSVSFGVGINLGPAVVGNIGSPDRRDYTAIGDTVNTASRLEARAPGGAVYISRSVADALGDRAKTTSLGPMELKGKAGGFEVLTLDALD